MSNTLEQYLSAAIERGQIDHVLRASRSPSGKVTFYVRPLNGDGETLDFVVRGNGLALNLTSDSDVHQGIDSLLETRIPILDQIRELCYAIEKCGASPELTDAVTKAGALREPITQLVEQAISLGIENGWFALVASEKPAQGEVYAKPDKIDTATPEHTVEDDFQHFLSYSGLGGGHPEAIEMMRMAYTHGAAR